MATPPRPGGAGLAMQQSFVVVRKSNPIQYPRSYWVDGQLWTVFSTLAQDSMEVHVARTDLHGRTVVREELLTPPNHSTSAFASLAQSPERLAIAYDDEGYGGVMTRLVMFNRPASAALEQPQLEAGMWAQTSSASMAYSPTLREWATFSASRDNVWSVRLRADGTLIDGSGLRLPGLDYERRCGERFLWNGAAWVALVHDNDGRLAFVERDAQQHRVRRLGLRVAGSVTDAAFAFERGRYAIAWIDDEGAKVSIVHNEQQFTPVQLLASASTNPGTPVVAFDRGRIVALWTQTGTLASLRRAVVSDVGAASPSELVASDPSQHVWWPHITQRDGDRPMVITFQVGQTEARVWSPAAP
ncbi:MAG: hypothetical protein JNK05_38460 [Myxococcales bacterium]|nr:hypothetical protein [Myxococcales bacterium]